MAPFFTPEIISRFLSGLPSLSGNRILTNEDENGELQDSLVSVIENVSDICRGLIGDSYLEETIIDKAFSEDKKYDAAILIEDGDESPVSFIVVELGECKRRPYNAVWSVNLICSKVKSKSGRAGMGQVLMGLYLYSIALNPVVESRNKYGILELANAYVNASGLASYSKLGFGFDASLWGEDCFADHGNLPMRTKVLMGEDSEEIIQILNGPTGELKTRIEREKPAVCKVRGHSGNKDRISQEEDEQLYLGLCKNLLIFLNVESPTDQLREYIIEDYSLADKRVVDYVLLYQHLNAKFNEENPLPRSTMHAISERRSTRLDPLAPNPKEREERFKEWLTRKIADMESNFDTISLAPGFANLNEEQNGKRIVTLPVEENPQTVSIKTENIKSRLRSAFRIPTVTVGTRTKREALRKGGRRRTGSIRRLTTKNKSSRTKSRRHRKRRN
jgi:hypothetical protein